MLLGLWSGGNWEWCVVVWCECELDVLSEVVVYWWYCVEVKLLYVEVFVVGGLWFVWYVVCEKDYVEVLCLVVVGVGYWLSDVDWGEFFDGDYDICFFFDFVDGGVGGLFIWVDDVGDGCLLEVVGVFY